MTVKPFKGKYASRRKSNEVNDMLALATRPDRTELEKEAKEFIEIIRKRRTSDVKTLEAMKEYEEGKSIGPFNSVKDFMADLYT